MKLLKFEAPWCQPCKNLTKVLSGIEIPYEVEVINIDEDMAKAQKYNVRGVPTLILVADDDVVKTTHVGSMTKDLFIEKFL